MTFRSRLPPYNKDLIIENKHQVIIISPLDLELITRNPERKAQWRKYKFSLEILDI